jgi:hypothetical protein
MPNTIDLLAGEGSSLDRTLYLALDLLKARGVKALTGQVLRGDDAPIGRILLINPADRARSTQILVNA